MRVLTVLLISLLCFVTVGCDGPPKADSKEVKVLFCRNHQEKAVSELKDRLSPANSYDALVTQPDSSDPNIQKISRDRVHVIDHVVNLLTVELRYIRVKERTKNKVSASVFLYIVNKREGKEIEYGEVNYTVSYTTDGELSVESVLESKTDWGD